MQAASSQAGMMMANSGRRIRCDSLGSSKSSASRRYSKRGGRTSRRQAEHELSFRDHLPAHAGLRFELPKLADLRQLFRAQQDLFLRPHRREKLHRANGGEQEKRPRIFRKSRGGSDPGRLRERFRQDHAGDERIAREMASEHRIVAREARRALRELARLAVEQLPNENERRPMRKRGDE